MNSSPINYNNYLIDDYTEIENNKSILGFINNYYDDEKMIKTYPNIMIEDSNNNIVYVDSLFDGYKNFN